MRKILTFVVALLCVANLAATLSIDTAVLPSVNMQEALEMAKQNNPAYQAGRASLEAAKWGKTSAGSAMLPSVSLSGTWLYNDPATTVSTGAGSFTLNKDIRTFSLNLSQPLFVGGKLWNAYKISDLGRDVAALGLENAELTLIAEVESKYLNILQMHEYYQIAVNDLESARRNLELAQLKLENGILSMADYLKFKSREASKEVSLLQASTGLHIALKDFANYLGSDAMLMPVPLPENPADEMLNRLDALSAEDVRSITSRALGIARDDNLSLRIIDKSLQMSKRAWNIAKGSFLPTVMLTGSRQYKENGIDRYEFTAANQLLLNVSVPLLPQIGNYASTRKAEWEYRKAEWEAKSADRGLALGIEAALLNLISSAKQVKANKLTLEYTTATYEQLRERFNLNMLSTLELLDAELMLSAAKTTYVTSIYTFYKNRTALQNALSAKDSGFLADLISNTHTEDK